MRRSIVKSANVLATLSVVTGVIGSAAHAGQSFSIPQYEVTVPAPVGSAIDQMDANLRAQFPTKLSAADRENALVIHGGSAVIAAIAGITANRVGRKTDARLQAQLAHIQQQVETRLPVLNAQIDLVQRDIDVLTRKTEVIQQHIDDPKAAVQNLLSKLNEESTEVKALILERERDITVLAEMEKAGATTQTKEITAAISAKKVEMQRAHALLDKQYQQLFSEAAEIKSTGTLPRSMFGGTNLAQIYLGKDEATRAMVSLKAEQQAINSKMLAVSSKVAKRGSFFGKVRKAGAGSLRLVAVAGSMVIVANGTSGYYIGYVLGQDPTQSPLIKMAQDAPNTVEYQATEQFMRDAAASIAQGYETAVQSAKDAGQAAQKRVDDLRK